MTAALNEAGVTFVKIGQILSTRRDLLAGEVVDELQRLQDDADPVPWPEVEAVLVAALGRPVLEVFAEIDQQPLAAASVGQVHSARLLTGEAVVVKVRRPGIEQTVERDLDIARWLAGRLQGWTQWAGLDRRGRTGRGAGRRAARGTRLSGGGSQCRSGDGLGRASACAACPGSTGLPGVVRADGAGDGTARRDEAHGRRATAGRRAGWAGRGGAAGAGLLHP